MPMNSQHPDYLKMRLDWDVVRDCLKGERWVKGLGKKYLPPTVGMIMDGMDTVTSPGLVAYEAYKMRAQFPDFVGVGVETLVGILHAKPWEIKLPAGMEWLNDKASNKGEKLLALARRMSAEQVSTGRLGLLVDMPSTPDQTNPQPYIAMYNAESIINWDDSDDNQGANRISLVVLDETSNVRTPSGLSWESKEKYRILYMDGSVYKQGVFEGSAELDVTRMQEPMLRGQKLTEIPFIFVNSKDTLATPDLPPLLGLAQLCMSIYRSEADYRQALFLQGQDTLVVIGGINNTNGEPSKPTRVGAGAKIDVNIGGDAKFIGVNSQGISEMRTALDSDRKAAAVRTGQLLAPGKMSMESGEALKTRVAAQTATLTSVALSGAAALEKALKFIARWMGKNEDEVKVTPNLDFTNVEIAGQDIVQLMTGKNLGMPLSFRTLHTLARERGLTKLTFEEEMREIAEDPKILIDRAMELAAGLKGNNPLEAAGGPKKKPEDDRTGASNKQT